MLLIPFSDALIPPAANPETAGTIKSSVDIANIDCFHSTVVTPVNSLFLFGDNTGGTVTWTDITDASNNHTTNDMPGANSEGDSFFVALSEGDVVESLDFYVTTAGVYSGTPTATVYYRNSSNELKTFTVTRDLLVTGVRRFMFPNTLSYDTMGYLDDPRDISLPRRKAFTIKYTNLGTVTTSAKSAFAWLRRPLSAAQTLVDYTSMATAVDKTPWQNTNVLVFNGSRTFVGCSKKFYNLFLDIVRSREASWTSKLIYSKADGTFGDLTTSQYSISSGTNGNDEVGSGSIGKYVDVFYPPSDWAAVKLVGDPDNKVNYWIGWEYTADSTAPQPIVLFSLKASKISANAKGVRAGETATYTLLEMFADKSSPVATTIAVTNKTTQQNAYAELQANQTTVSTTINFKVSVSDEVVLQVLKGDSNLGLADGLIRLS